VAGRSLAGNVKPRVLADYRANYRRYVSDPLGERAVATITAADVRRWRAELMEPRPRPAHGRPKGTTGAEADQVTLSRSTVKHAFETLRRILDVAVVDGALTANPCASVPRTRTADPDAELFAVRSLTAAEIAAVAEHIGRVQGHPIYGLVVLFAAFTGLRAGELPGLNVGDLLLPQIPGSAGSVSVTRTRRAVTGGWETGSPKSAKWRRFVPIDGWLATICAPTWPTIIRTATRHRPTTIRLHRCFRVGTFAARFCRSIFRATRSSQFARWWLPRMHGAPKRVAHRIGVS
jgi:integrase